jgi:membrane protease subunit HflK
MLDYQFGFGVSETWLYRFALRSALPLCGFAAFCLLVFSCVVSVNPGERAVVETWGMPSEAVREPGLSLKLPWPIQRVKRVYPERVRELTVGAVDASGTGLWRVEGVEDDLFLSAGSPTDDQRPAVADADPDTSRRGTGIPAANLLAVGLTVRYEISDIADYLYRYSEPEAVLLSVARREMTAFLATHDGLDLHRRQGGELASALQERLNGLSEELHMGVRITWTAVSRLQPPGPVVGAFRAVASEMQQSETRALAARRYASETVPLGEAVAAERVSSAHASVVSRVSQAKAFADLFRQRREDNATNPDLYRALRLLSTLEDGLAGLPKVVIGADGGGEVFQIDLKDSTVPELLDFGVPTGSGE